MKIATLGAATFDVFLIGEALRAKRDVRTYDYVEQFELGAKLELENIVYSTGGGATNAAVTFARQGFDVSFFGKVGDDLPGREVIKSLQNEGIRTSNVAIDLDGGTGYSTLLLAPRGERTILVYRGVSQELKPSDFNFAKTDIQWLYISSVAGNLNLLKQIIRHFKAKGTKIAYNPGSRELKQADELRIILPEVDILFTNKQEMKKIVSAEDKKLLKLASKLSRVVVISDGAKGSIATDGIHSYAAGMYKDVKVVDRTGAGDAFCSGFVAARARGDSLVEALTFASANSTSVVKHIGAKTGILKKSARLKDMDIKVTDL